MQTLHLNLGKRSYDINIGEGILSSCEEYFNLSRKVLVLTDSGVPEEYARCVASKSKDAKIVCVPMGEGSKSLGVLEDVLREMLEFEMGRGDCLVAVGGGVVGDLGGFAAATYMRGIDFYGVPTTLLSQVDSSIGGKCAVNLGGVKNSVGAFHQPRGVLIDPCVIDTLPKRQIASGLSEAIKMAITSDASLFEMIEREGFNDQNREKIIVGALNIKKAVVEEDEKETGKRRILNFGHTLGHGIESQKALGELYHGECVALGMLPVIARSERERVTEVLRAVGLPMDKKYDLDGALSFVVHDKKCQSGYVEVILSDKIGECRIERMSVSEFEKAVREALE